MTLAYKLAVASERVRMQKEAAAKAKSAKFNELMQTPVMFLSLLAVDMSVIAERGGQQVIMPCVLTDALKAVLEKEGFAVERNPDSNQSTVSWANATAWNPTEPPNPPINEQVASLVTDAVRAVVLGGRFSGAA